ncbi:hypothetical protein Pcinc_000329 [Petrolisthes cinctipes]|uniref:Organic cation transporter n=1 Tax=Petrolisthes cinctipes TaxID=88211 RepID=A0AAE1L6J0_PETCI|nr:hypothetical protein Pcinc_000329 [Petrolisthes cinctipes]
MNIIRRNELSGELEKEQGDTRSLRSVVVAVVRKAFLLLITPKVRQKACIVFFLWLATSIIYYGVSLNSYNLSTNLYMYTFLSGLLEIPAYLLLWLASTTLGRKRTLMCLYLTCSVSISVLTALIMLLEEVPSWAKMVLSLSGKMAITAAYGLVWYYSTELFSTKYRSRVMGEANMFARLGSSCSPYINDIFGEVMVWGPSAVFSLATLAAAFIVTLLPETKNKIMAQGIDDQPEHVMEHVPSRPEHDPPRTQYDPLRTQYDPSTTQT